MKIAEVELDHCAYDLDDNATHAILLVTLDNGDQRHLEVALPDPETLREDPALRETK